MDEDVLGLWGLHGLASQFGDGLKPGLVECFFDERSPHSALNVVDCTLLFRRRGIESQSPVSKDASAAVTPLSKFHFGKASDQGALPPSAQIEREPKA